MSGICLLVDGVLNFHAEPSLKTLGEETVRELLIVKETADSILRDNPDSVVRFRLLRDVLRVHPRSNDFIDA